MSTERTGKQRTLQKPKRHLQRGETMPARWGERSISFWHVHFQSSSMQTALPAGWVGRCGLKTNAKIGSTFSPQAGNFQTKNTETDTSDVGVQQRRGEVAHEHWLGRGPRQCTALWLALRAFVRLTFVEIPSLRAVWMWVGLMFVLVTRIQGRRRWGLPGRKKGKS